MFMVKLSGQTQRKVKDCMVKAIFAKGALEIVLQATFIIEDSKPFLLRRLKEPEQRSQNFNGV